MESRSEATRTDERALPGTGLDGAEPADFAISVVAGAASGGASVPAALSGTSKQIVVNAGIGGLAAAGSGVVHGNVNSADVLIAAVISGAGAKYLPSGGRSLLTSQALKGSLAAVGQNSVAAGISQWFRDHPLPVPWQ